MAGQLEWKERYNVGVELIDGQHQRLFRIVNKLRAVSEEEDKESWACQEGVKYFINYAARHFTDEEKYMASISYEGLEVHRQLHEDFRSLRLPALEQELEESNYTEEAIEHFRGICTGWLIDHIQVEDQLIMGRGASKWDSLLPEGKLRAVEQEVVAILNEMFGKEPRLISRCYSGEKFGEGMFFRFSYSSKERKRRDMVLVFEKKLLMDMMEKVADDPQEKSLALLLEVVRSTAKEFEDINGFSFLEKGYELTGENQLSGSQFPRILQRQHPRFSLLFDTGAGYFGYCVMAPYPAQDEELPQEEDGELSQEEGGDLFRKEEQGSEEKAVLPKDEKAPEEKETVPTGKAFSEKVSSEKASSGKEKVSPKRGPKKKVLVVDDSKLTRQVMMRVLQEDYQVTLAKSGIAAIRCMALQKPDLILLDYNMPVCDGPKLLEMIRSEEDFAEVPVIFLSSSVDKEGVKRVLPFKPEGYLLKSLKPTDIKEKIDRYFNRKG